MGNIVILDENTSNKIAAGEVVERPASVIKELVENSIDAGASSISVEIKNGGITYIKVADNGSGIQEDDIEIAFERHATSKIRYAEDLESIMTMGFRGEALASIAAVSAVELTTRTEGGKTGNYIMVRGGVLKEVRQVGASKGTVIMVRDLFYNTPARFKFLKKNNTEAGYVSDVLSRIALSRPDISIKLVSSGTTVFHTPGNNDQLSAIYCIYGKEIAKQVYPIDYNDIRIKISGYAGKPEISRSNRNHQSLFINGRYIRSKLISSAIDEAYRTYLMKNKFAFIVLNIEVNPMLIDVNVHPTKMEVRFSHEQEVFRAVHHGVTEALQKNSHVRAIDGQAAKISTLQSETKKETKETKEYVQQHLNSKNNGLPESIAGIQEKRDAQSYYSNNSNYSEDTAGNSKDFTNSQKPNPIEYGQVSHAEPKKELISGLCEAKEKMNSDENSVCIDKAVIKSADAEKVKLNQSAKVPDLQGHIEPKAHVSSENKNEISLDKAKNNTDNILTGFRIIGQVFDTYILLEKNDNFVLIDQHAAHERILFENLRKKLKEQQPFSQMLLAPLAIRMTDNEIRFLDEEKNFFEKLGFIYEDFGNNSIILRAVPNILGDRNITDNFLEIVDEIINKGKYDFKKNQEQILYSIACKAAIKANKKLNILEIEKLIHELNSMDNLYTCPHGRPTVIKITKHEIEKMFKRIV